MIAAAALMVVAAIGIRKLQEQAETKRMMLWG